MKTPCNGENELVSRTAELLERLDDKGQLSQLQTMLLDRPRQLTLVRQQISHSGPLPDPDSLMKYEDAHKGLAERIVSMAEKEQQHRHLNQSKIVDEEVGKNKRGQYIGGAIALASLSIAALLALNDHDWVAGIIGGSTVIGLCTIFVLGRVYEAKQEKQSDESDISE